MASNVKPVTHTGITAELVRKSKRHLVAGGFDPNEDPVIIGAGANIDTTATPSNPDSTFSGAIVIGQGAYAEVDAYGSSVIIGQGASSTGTGDDAVAIGAGAIVTDSSGGVAIGLGSSAWLDSVAIGSGSLASSDGSAVALGSSAYANDAYSVALGSGATTTKPNQIMLGSTSQFVEIPGHGAANGLVLTDITTLGRGLVQLDNGVLVVNTAP